MSRKEALKIIEKYKSFIYYNKKYMSEAEYWRLKCYGEI